MASNHTTNYQLNQWAKSDRILMDDFNADNAKIDAALAAHAAALAGCGNCKIEFGSYTGDGTVGLALTFSARPVAVFIQANASADFGMMLRGSETIAAFSNCAFAFLRCTWTETGITIERLTTGDTDRTTLNERGKTYSYAVLLPMDE